MPRKQATTLDPLIQTHRQEILALAEKRGARNLRLFGSFARGEAGPTRDVDFLVGLDPGRTLLDLGALLMDLQDLLNRKIQLVEAAGLHWYLRDRVLREAIPL